MFVLYGHARLTLTFLSPFVLLRLNSKPQRRCPHTNDFPNGKTTEKLPMKKFTIGECVAFISGWCYGNGNVIPPDDVIAKDFVDWAGNENHNIFALMHYCKRHGKHLVEYVNQKHEGALADAEAS
jgi:hypothetical protein